MSEIPLIPLDQKIDNLVIQDNTFKGTGELFSPFTMVDVSNEQTFKSLGNGYHAFNSWLPLFDAHYWIFILKGELKNDLPALIYQRLPILDGDFEFYFLKTPKPLRYRSINFFDHQYPYTTPAQQRRTGKINGVNLTEETQSNSILDFDEFPNNFIDSITTDEIIRLQYGEQIGVDNL